MRCVNCLLSSCHIPVFKQLWSALMRPQRLKQDCLQIEFISLHFRLILRKLFSYVEHSLILKCPYYFCCLLDLIPLKLHYALLALLSLSTLVFRNNMCHCLSVCDVLIARWAVVISQFSNHSELHWWDLKGRNRTVCISQFSNHSELHWWDLKGRNRTVCRLRLIYIYIYIYIYT